MADGQAYLPAFSEDYNRRFARLARNAYDAHRAMPDLTGLDDVFTLQEERRVSKNLTLAHQRILYVLEDTAENRRLRGHQVTVHEHEDGRITIRHAGRTLVHQAHPKDMARITQGAIVEHKRLAAALTWIAAQQRERDLVRLASPALSLRAKKRIRATAATTTLAHPSG
jgi:hypothetical protein